MSITKKIIATIILVCMIFSSIAPVVDAAVDNTTLFKTEEDILYEQNKDTKIDQTQQNKDETYAKDNEEKITSFDVLMADVLTKKEGESFNLNDIPSIILQKPSKNGVWIEESSREYVINLINETTNKTYKIDEDGFLVEDKNAPKKIINDEFKVFTQKIDTLLSNEKLIRNRLKINASINNSKIFKEIQNEYGSFYNYLKTFTNDTIVYEINKTTSPLSDSISKDLKSRGMKFVGSTIIYSYLQAIGVIYSHDKKCFMNNYYKRIGLIG